MDATRFAFECLCRHLTVLHSESIKVSRHEATVELTTENPRVVALDRYFESPAAACVALGISQPTLTKMIRDSNVRSVKIGNPTD